MTPRSAAPDARRRSAEDDVRRLRDLLREAVLRGDFADGLPSEAALMAREHARRATVRDALSLLRDEGLVARTQGVGTYAVTRALPLPLDEMHGAAAPRGDSLLNRRTRPRIVDRSVQHAPHAVASVLGVAAGLPCLRLEYVAMVGDEPLALATNYMLFPEAERLLVTPFDTDFYALLDEAGVELGDSEMSFSPLAADASTAARLGVGVGTPVLAVQQILHDADGRAFDLAFVRSRGDRFVVTSRAGRHPHRKPPPPRQPLQHGTPPSRPIPDRREDPA